MLRRSPAPKPEPPKGNEDAYLAISTIGPLANNADTKIGFVATALTVLTTGVVRQRPRVDALIDGGVGLRDVVALGCLAISAAMIVLAGYWLFRALSPRLTNPKPSRFAFPHLAGADLETLAQPDPIAGRAEAWVQAQTLSRIVLDKFTYFRKALGAGLGAGAAFVGWLLVVPL
ncbi:hypothetical protein SAMN05660359_04454 [Geodermatophilus obscurus]|uniref:Pycsar effector protein domain-containing protein n=1 Tax=Geodermatophilus obscurus TaxID=1861 RepID=A0A1I5IB76_9ACTN|nr:hypothetical protein [Geodermatophilus obscurus]SFO57261.1 hypothetical protein SAMN05660359_04454 [Geodermatophilus obscurus]